MCDTVCDTVCAALCVPRCVQESENHLDRLIKDSGVKVREDDDYNADPQAAVKYRYPGVIVHTSMDLRRKLSHAATLAFWQPVPECIFTASLGGELYMVCAKSSDAPADV